MRSLLRFFSLNSCILLGRQRHCENKVFSSGTQHNGPSQGIKISSCNGVTFLISTWGQNISLKVQKCRKIVIYRLWFVVSQGNRWMNTIPLSSSLSSRRSATGTSTGKEATGSQHVLKDYLKRRNLILALIRREIERLSTWHNPLARPELSFTGMESLVNWANQTVFTERIWRDLVRLAWHISPDIAVFLPARYVLV